MTRAMSASNKLLFLFFTAILIVMGIRFPRETGSPDAGDFSYKASFPMPDSSGYEIGDVLLRKGNSIISDMIVTAFPEGRGMSHCGILVRQKGRWMVIHTISGRISEYDGIRINTVAEFVSGAHQGKILHVKPVFEIDRDLVSKEAFEHLARKAPFDHSFDLGETESLYCSELIRCAYLEAGAEDPFTYRKIGKRQLIDMASFIEPTRFIQMNP